MSSVTPQSIQNSPLSSLASTGLVSPNASIAVTSTPASIPQTVSSSLPSLNNVRRTGTLAPLSSVTARTAATAPTYTPPTLTNATYKSPRSVRSPRSVKSVRPLTTETLKITPDVPASTTPGQEFVVSDFQGQVPNSDIENELLNLGYAPLSKIIVNAEGQGKQAQYIKAVNKKGQKVFILLDVGAYVTVRATDLTLIEAGNASIIPYSIKTGAYSCASKDVCGVAFECGPDGICTLIRDDNDLSPKETNLVYIEQSAPSAASMVVNGDIVTYPVVKLSEIRANPNLVLENTNLVTKRLRNTDYSVRQRELAETKNSISILYKAIEEFETEALKAAATISSTLRTLNEYNDIYMVSPPVDDASKDKYRILQHNLEVRYDGFVKLLNIMKRATDKKPEIDNLTREFNELKLLVKEEFDRINGVVTD